MPDRYPPDFAAHVWDAAARLGRSAPRIVDNILREAFPGTTAAAQSEGATKILRTGCISEVKRVLRNVPQTEGQMRFDEIDASFRPYVEPLQRPSYYVPEREEEVLVADLIASPDQLDAARNFMRRKGMECLAEAERLDVLYEAVVAHDPASDPRPASCPPHAANHLPGGVAA
jgi:hypothetical protein